MDSPFKIGLVVLSIVLLFTTCVREVTIDLPEETQKTVIVGHFEAGKPISVTLTRSQSVFETSDFEVVTDAQVSISVDGNFWNKLDYKYDSEQSQFFWKTKKLAEPETQYTIAVQLPVPNEPDLEATSSTPLHVPLRSIVADRENIRKVTLPDGSLALRVPLELTLQYLPSKHRFFGFYFQHETAVFKNDPVVGKILDFEFVGKSSFSGSGRTLSLLSDLTKFEPLVMINENYWSDNNNVLSIDAIIPIRSNLEIPQRLFISWRTLSEEFYRYHLSVARQSTNNPLNDPDAIFNNVKNGYGNFSGFAISIDTIKL